MCFFHILSVYVWKIKLVTVDKRAHYFMYELLGVISHYEFAQNEYYVWIILRYFSTILCEEFPFVSSRISYVQYIDFLEIVTVLFLEQLLYFL